MVKLSERLSEEMVKETSLFCKFVKKKERKENLIKIKSKVIHENNDKVVAVENQELSIFNASSFF